MICPHCGTVLSRISPFHRPVAGGRAYAQTCTRCRHIVGIRPQMRTDPPCAPADLTHREIERLLFVRWLRERDLIEVDVPAA